jgi:hypothetical protein
LLPLAKLLVMVRGKCIGALFENFTEALGDGSNASL